MKMIKTLLKNQVRNISYKRVQTWYASLLKPRQNDPPYDHVVQIGDPILRAKADEVPIEEIKSNEVKFLVSKMKHVFKKFDCVGLAAPQIGIPFRVFMVELNEKHFKSISKTERDLWEVSLLPFTVVINPEIKIIDYKKLYFPEACQSVMGFYADVPRYRGIELNDSNVKNYFDKVDHSNQILGFDAEGNSLHLTAVGWMARIIQHEIDHLNGRMYTDIMDRKTLTCSCWEVINERRGKVELPYGAS